MNSKDTENNVKKALREIRPFLQRDGGDVSLISIKNNDLVEVRLEGTCAGCNINTITLKMGIEATIKRYVPHIKTVINVE